MTERPYHHIHPALQLVYLILICVGCGIIGAVISIAIIAGIYGLPTLMDTLQISEHSSPDAISAFKILLAFGNTIALFLAPAIFFAYLIVRAPREYLRTNTRVSWALPLIVLAIMLFSAPVMEWLVNINQKLSLPASLKGIEDWMRKSEDDAAKMVKIVLQMNTPGEFVFSLIIIGLLPAIAEEFLFRGAIQTIFLKWTKNVHAAVWISAILFSALHMQFFGFLPRVMLGVLFGYFVVWSGSIWTSVWAHFINNGLAVVMTYLFQHKMVNIDPDNQHVFNLGAYLFSLVVTVALLLLYKRIAAQHEVVYEDE